MTGIDHSNVNFPTLWWCWQGSQVSSEVEKTAEKNTIFSIRKKQVSSSFFHEIWKKLKNWENIGEREYHFTNNVTVLCLKSKNIK